VCAVRGPQDVFVAMWQAAAACIASVTSRTAASISTGLSLGTDLAAAARGVLLPLVALARRWLASAQTEAEDALRGATSALPPHVQKWISLALNGASRAVTVYLGYIYREVFFCSSLLFRYVHTSTARSSFVLLFFSDIALAHTPRA